MELWLVLETVTQQWLHPASVNQKQGWWSDICAMSLTSNLIKKLLNKWTCRMEWPKKLHNSDCNQNQQMDYNG